MYLFYYQCLIIIKNTSIATLNLFVFSRLRRIALPFFAFSGSLLLLCRFCFFFLSAFVDTWTGKAIEANTPAPRALDRDPNAG